MDKMVVLLITGIVVFLISFCIIITIKVIKKENNYFEKNKKHGKAIIVGYDSESSAYNVIFSVRILDIGDDHLYKLKGVYNVKKFNGKLDMSKPHFDIGDEVEVYYAPKTIVGIKVLEVKLDRDKYLYK